jgi:hypothetical protein
MVAFALWVDVMNLPNKVNYLALKEARKKHLNLVIFINENRLCLPTSPALIAVLRVAIITGGDSSGKKGTFVRAVTGELPGVSGTSYKRTATGGGSSPIYTKKNP